MRRCSGLLVWAVVVSAVVVWVAGCAGNGIDTQPAAESAQMSVAVDQASGQPGGETGRGVAGAERLAGTTTSLESPPRDRAAITTTLPMRDGETVTTTTEPWDGEADTTTTEPVWVIGATTTTTTVPPLEKERARFEDAAAPGWPFTGLVRLSSRPDGRVGWVLQYWSWNEPAQTYPQVPLEGLADECLGQMAMVVHDERGIEIGDVGDADGDVLRVLWGGIAEAVDEPSEEFLAWAKERPSNVKVATEGDRIHLSSGEQQRSYAMRSPVRPDGDRWTAQARHDGALFILTVHPAHLPCYSGVTWITLAETGEFVTCGANTAATAFVSPRQQSRGKLALPDPDIVGTYLSCAPELNLSYLPFTRDRQLVKP